MMGVSLEWNNEQNDLDITVELIAKLQSLLKLAAEQENIDTGEVVLSFVDDAAMQQLNKDYRGMDYSTDVLSFAMQEEGEDELPIIYDTADHEEEPVLLGDIVISVPKAIAQSKDFGHSVEREIGFLFVHGFLHLLGYDHQEDEAEKVMTAKQEQVLQKAGLTR